MDEHTKQVLLLAREHFQKREMDKAEYLLKQVAAQTDRFADVFDMLGVIAHSKGEFADAERCFERAVAINPSYTEAQLNLMVTYNDLGKYDAARTIYASIRARARPEAEVADPFARGRLANMHADLAQAYLDVGMPIDAARELQRAVDLCPTFADLRTRLGNVYRDQGEVERALVEYEAAKAANPKYLQARVALAVLLLSRGDARGAIAELEEVAAIDPEHKTAQMYLRVARSGAKSMPPPA